MNMNMNIRALLCLVASANSHEGLLSSISHGALSSSHHKRVVRRSQILGEPLSSKDTLATLAALEADESTVRAELNEGRNTSSLKALQQRQPQSVAEANSTSKNYVLFYSFVIFTRGELL